MLRGNNEDMETEHLAGLCATSSSSRPGCRSHHWRQPGLASRRCSPRTIDSALNRVAASVAAIRAYLDRLKDLEQWLSDRMKAIEICLDRVRCVEKVVSGEELTPSLPGECHPSLLLVACYADLARQALRGPSDVDNSPAAGWSSSGGDQSDGDVKTSLTPDSLFKPLHDAAITAGLAVLAATDQRVPAAALQVEGADDAITESITLDNLTTEQRREYTCLMSVLPPVQKPGRRFDLLSLLTKSLSQLKWYAYALGGDVDSADDGRQQASSKVIDSAQLRPFTDFVSNSRPIVRLFSLPPDRRLVLFNVDDQHRGTPPPLPEPIHSAPSVLMKQLADVVQKDVQRRFQTETYSANVVLEQLTRRLDTAPRTADSAVELARELETHVKLLEMSSRYDNMDALTHCLITCAVERVRTQTATIIDKWKTVCPCRSVYHVVVQ